MFRRYCIQNVKDRLQILVYKINNESVTHFSQLISVKVKKNLRKSQTQFREKLRKLRHRQNNGFLIKKTCIQAHTQSLKFKNNLRIMQGSSFIKIFVYLSYRTVCI